MEVGYKHGVYFLCSRQLSWLFVYFYFRKNVVVHPSNLSVLKGFPVFQRF
jgi:hypothetical protein